jgi:hypothetical protein
MSFLIALFITVVILTVLGLATLACNLLWGNVLAPLIEGDVTQPNVCCPPGLGCNDPSKHRRKCRRELAYSVADVEDGIALDHAWRAFNETSPVAFRQRARRLRQYGRTRDNILERRLQQITDAMHTPGNELPEYGEAMRQIESGRGVTHHGEVL